MTDTPRRLLHTKEAAKYCGVPRSYFPKVCPARPVQIREKAAILWDIKDLDKWIDSIKAQTTKEGPRGNPSDYL